MKEREKTTKEKSKKSRNKTTKTKFFFGFVKPK
jgi:hypothetical protein